jgi:protein phosphatase 1 regulatory subunit 7
LSGNKIPDFGALEKELRAISALKTLYLEANPCETNDRVHYRRKVMLALPQLTQIDAT